MHNWKANLWVVVLLIAVAYFVGIIVWEVFCSLRECMVGRWYHRTDAQRMALAQRLGLRAADRAFRKPWYVRQHERRAALRESDGC